MEQNIHKTNEFCDKDELDYTKSVLSVIDKKVGLELESLKRKRGIILDERQYFMDYLPELAEDEVLSLVRNEMVDTSSYESVLNEVVKLEKQKREPYFGRFDFTEEGESESERFYIGIFGLKDPENSSFLVFDWRAPVASLYYDYEPGECSYKAPLGNIRGVMSLKRKYRFTAGKLHSYYDVSMPSDDETLMEVLKSNSGSSMKTIVNTIQKEQNKIIRDYIEGISVIQGCAGSGKSSIALHKAAYVLYSFRERLKTEELVIISPNDMFSKYISNVLPDLGEKNLIELLPEDILLCCFDREADIKFLSRPQTVEFILECSKTDNSLAERSFIMSGEGFRQIMLSYCKYLAETIFIPIELYLDEDMENYVSTDELSNLFYSEFKEFPVFYRQRKMAGYICEKYDIKSMEMKNYFADLLLEMLISNNLNDLYEMMFENMGFRRTLNDDLKMIFDKLGPVDNLWFEDGGALALMALKLCEPELNNRVFYLLADEAQDYSPVFLEVLKTVYRGSNMLFVGDKNQLVFNNSGNYLEDIEKVITKRPFRKYELLKSYRSTKQIMEYAQKIIGSENIEVIREGEAVEEYTSDHLVNLIGFLKSSADKGYENIAVICETESDAKVCASDVVGLLGDTGLSDIRILPVYLAKGLEFDSVAVWNVKGKFNKKGLYTACTRAMHRLAVFNQEA
ncbi:MAG: AAA family ATPase [Clostridiales bacterium]|jgi:DNA helicase-2/ATP-dependent DNA helicase PcrA|nr:AAA family ATPase [Clostridiales bacterium]